MTPSVSMEELSPGAGSIVVSSTTIPLPHGLPPGQSLIVPPCRSTRRIVTFGAWTRMSAFTSRMSCTTAPGVVTTRSDVRVCAGTQPAGTPVVDGLGNPTVRGAGDGVGGVGAGVDAPLDVRRTVNLAVRRALWRGAPVGGR